MAYEALRLTEALIACRSVTPDDGGACALLGERLSKAGFEVERLDAGPDGARVSNLWAVHDAGRPGLTVVLMGHLDVVPPGPLEHWRSDPFVPAHRDGRLFSRGAADMKTACAAMTVAAEAFVAAQPSHAGRIALLFTSDEEGPSLHGVRHVVDVFRSRGERLDACIVGEPTSVERVGDMVKNGRRGTLGARLVIEGVQGHVAYPTLARNPLHDFAPALAELVAARWDDGNQHFPPTSFQVSNIAAGTGALNMIPGHATVDFNFRLSTESSPESLKQRVGAILAKHRVAHRIEWTLGGMPFLTPLGSLSAALIDAIGAEFGIEPEVSTTGGTSDGRFVATICPQVMEFGVVNASAHKVDEWVDSAAIEPLSRVYRRAVEALLSPSGAMMLADWVQRMSDKLDAAAVAFGHGTTNAFDEAAWLVLWRLGLPLDAFDEHAARELDAAEMRRCEALIDQRIETRKPAAYLTGEAWLRGVPFFADARALVPRSLIVEPLADGSIDAWLGDEPPVRVLDLCTGGGSLAVLAALAWPQARVLGADIDADALALARSNVERHELADRIELRLGDGLAALRAADDGGTDVEPERFDLILCNPPYVNRASMAALPAEYRAEPALALDGNVGGGSDGMDFVRPLIAGAAAHLETDGLLVLEIGHEREHFEAAFPALDPVWLPTGAGDDQVLLLSRAELERAAGR